MEDGAVDHSPSAGRKESTSTAVLEEDETGTEEVQLSSQRLAALRHLISRVFQVRMI